MWRLSLRTRALTMGLVSLARIQHRDAKDLDKEKSLGNEIDDDFFRAIEIFCF